MENFGVTHRKLWKNLIRSKIMAMEIKWKRLFVFPVSKNTIAILEIYGEKPPDNEDLNLLTDYMDMAKKALLKNKGKNKDA